MKNAFSRMGKTCASVLMAGGLMAGALLAGTESRVSVTLPHAVAVGGTVLPAGDYTISSVDIAGNEGYFVVRSSSTPAVTLQAQRINSDEQDKTSLVFSRDGDVWHFEKMFVRGDAVGYQFVNLK